MEIIQVKMSTFKAGESLEKYLKKNLPQVKNGDIILIASKIVSLSEQRITKGEINKDLIKREATAYISTNKSFITLKNHAIQINAGIDKTKEELILLPENPQISAQTIWTSLKKIFNLDKLGVIICDSRSTPMRRGVSTYSIGYWGFEPLQDQGESKDYTGWTVNIVDALAALGSLYLGESSEQKTPIAILRNIKNIHFTDKPKNSLFIDKNIDMYKPLFNRFKKIS